MSLSSLSENDQAARSDTSFSAILQSSPSYLILALVLTVFAVVPLFYPGYIQTHSGFVSMWNVADLWANLGDWRWLPHIATSFDPLRSDGLWPYYLAAILPFESAKAVKVILGLSWLLGSAGMFLWLKNWWGQPGALVAALVYTYLPHQIATVYVRGAWGEAFFWGLLPWAILVGDSTRKSSPLLSILGAFLWLILGLSQLGLTSWAFIFVALLLLFSRGRQVAWPILSALVGLVLAAVITLTVSSASPLVSSPPPFIHFSDHFLYPFQLFSAHWGFGPSRLGWKDGLSFQLGLAAIGLTILTVMLWLQRRSSDPAIKFVERPLVFFMGGAIVCILLQFGFTEPFWYIPLWPGYILASTLTYPWQLLGLAGLCLAVLAGAGVRLDEQLARFPLFGSIIILVVLSSYSYLSPQFVQVELETMPGPQAELGATQLALLAHDFSVIINGNTAGLERGETVIPLAAHGPLQANDGLRLNVTWQPLQAFAEDWKVFVHLVNANGDVLVQFDGQPLEGVYPTSRWIPGELITDSYTLLLPEDTPSGPYRVFLGLYNEATGARLSVPGDLEGRIILDVE